MIYQYEVSYVDEINFETMRAKGIIEGKSLAKAVKKIESYYGNGVSGITIFDLVIPENWYCAEEDIGIFVKEDVQNNELIGGDILVGE